VLQNRGGADTAQLSQVLQGLLAGRALEIGLVYSGFDPRIRRSVHGRPRQVKSRHQLSDVFFALQTFLGSYINDFNLSDAPTGAGEGGRSAASPTTSTVFTCAATTERWCRSPRW
jgi:hypothetical protein